jgi:hypothetical protein
MNPDLVIISGSYFFRPASGHQEIDCSLPGGVHCHTGVAIVSIIMVENIRRDYHKPFAMPHLILEIWDKDLYSHSCASSPNCFDDASKKWDDHRPEIIRVTEVMTTTQALVPHFLDNLFRLFRVKRFLAYHFPPHRTTVLVHTLAHDKKCRFSRRKKNTLLGSGSTPPGQYSVQAPGQSGFAPPSSLLRREAVFFLDDEGFSNISVTISFPQLPHLIP